jgi:hypothetical protein
VPFYFYFSSDFIIFLSSIIQDTFRPVELRRTIREEYNVTTNADVGFINILIGEKNASVDWTRTGNLWHQPPTVPLSYRGVQHHLLRAPRAAGARNIFIRGILQKGFSHNTYIEPLKDFLKTLNGFLNCENPLKVFWKTLGKGFSPKTLFGFQENLYRFFTLYEKLLRVGVRYMCW